MIFPTEIALDASNVVSTTMDGFNSKILCTKYANDAIFHLLNKI